MKTKKQTIWVVRDNQLVNLFHKKNDAVALFNKKRKYYDKHTAPTESDYWIYSPFFYYKEGDYESVHYIAKWEGEEKRFTLSVCEKEVL